jgi:hypothetical protein
MSRGRGRIERAIRQLFDDHPDLAFVTDELAEHCFPGVGIERKHQVSVLRAAHKVVAPDPDWTAWQIECKRRGWVFFNHASVQSYALGRMIAETYGARHDRTEMLARLQPGSVNDTFLDLCAPGGGWAGHVEMHRAAREGKSELVAALARQQKIAIAALLASAGAHKRFSENTDAANETLRRSEQLPTFADRARSLIAQNDPDVVRAGLAEIAADLDKMAGGR